LNYPEDGSNKVLLNVCEIFANVQGVEARKFQSSQTPFNATNFARQPIILKKKNRNLLHIFLQTIVHMKVQNNVSTYFWAMVIITNQLIK